MKGLVAGPRPDLTPSQLVAMVLAGIPILAQLLRAFGVFDLTIEEQAALSDAVTWCGVVAAALIGGDAIVRTGRNLRAGAVESAMASVGDAENLEFVQSHSVSTPPTVTTVTGAGGAVPPPTTTTGFEETPKG